MEETNLELRKDILNSSLMVEHQVSQVIAAYFQIEKDKTQTIGHKSSSLSFKNKIDLLLDLEILSLKEHADLLLLMVFRNKFMHIIECNSFKVAFTLLSKDYKTKLLKFDDLDFNSDEEFRYLNAFRALSLKCIDVLLQKLNFRHEMMIERSRMYSDLAEYSSFVINGLFNIIESTHDKFIPEGIEKIISSNALEERIEVIKFLYDELDNIMKSDSFNKLQESTSISLSSEKVIRLYR